MKTQDLNRRNFIQTGLLAATGLAAAATLHGEEQRPKLVKDKFVHSVYFWLKPGLSETQVEKFKKGLNSLTTIETVDHAFIGTPASTDRPIIDHSYSYALILVFNDKKAHDAYQTDPVHDEFRKYSTDLCAKVLIYDAV
jgi:hypothetical protein